MHRKILNAELASFGGNISRCERINIIGTKKNIVRINVVLIEDDGEFTRFRIIIQF